MIAALRLLRLQDLNGLTIRRHLVKTATGSTLVVDAACFCFITLVELEGVVIDVVASLAKNPHEGEAPLA